MLSLKIPINEVKLHEYNCPVCNNNNYYSIEQKNTHDITLDVCRYCGFMFRGKFLDGKSWILWEKSYHKSRPGIGYWFRENIKFEILNNILNENKLINISKRHLDIGSTMGDGIKKLGLDSICSEINDLHYKYAKHVLGLDVRQTLEINEGSFDLITAFSYLHFIPNIGKYLEYIKTKLNDNGYFILTVPILDGTSAELITQKLPLEICNFFTKKTLINLLEVNGFEIMVEKPTFKEHLIICKKGKVKDIKKYPDEITKLLNEILDIIELYSKLNLQINIGQKSLIEDKILNDMELKNVEIIKKILEIPIAKNYIDFISLTIRNRIEDTVFMKSYALRLEEQFPNDYVVLATLGVFYHNYKDFNKSIDFLLKAKKIFNNYEISYYLGLDYYYLGIYDKAIEYLKMALDFNPIKADEILELLGVMAGKIRN